MYKDGYKRIFNMDISRVVLDKMRDFYSWKEASENKRHADFQCKVTHFYVLDCTMDATQMNFRDNPFDLSIDKGTYDALAVLI